MTTMIDRDASALEGYVEVSPETADKISKIKQARINTKKWSEYRDQLVKDVKDVLDGHTGAVYGGAVIATVKHRAGRISVDRELLKALVDEETYEKVIKHGSTQTVLDVP